jgi:methylglyoxal synthase
MAEETRQEQKEQNQQRKTLIGVLASHDSQEKNQSPAELFAELYRGKGKKRLEQFHFLFTGGTFERVVLGKGKNAYPIPDPATRDFVKANSTRLPGFREGGVTLLANFIVQRQCSIVWPFLDPITTHWLNPDNLALMRLCDIWNVKRLMNPGSVKVWFHYEADRDAKRNLQTIPQDLLFGGGDLDPAQARMLVNQGWIDQWGGENDRMKAKERENKGYQIQDPIPKKRKANFWRKFQHQTIALIAHDAMKERMVSFAIEYERELSHFKRILTTGTTGLEVRNATRLLADLIKRCRSGPEGGDIEIATEVLYGRCDVVVFFLDPRHPHPHIEDIRTVFSACMREQETLMLTNEFQARSWMENAVRPHL